MRESARAITHKTESVMRLLTGGNLAVNPMLDNEFKQSVIEMHSNKSLKNDASPVEKNEPEIQAEKADSSENYLNEVIVSEELISELLPEALKRFGCCCCDKCYAEAMAEAFIKTPLITMNVSSDEDRKKLALVKKMNQKNVMKTIVKIALERKKLPRHN